MTDTVERRAPSTRLPKKATRSGRAFAKLLADTMVDFHACWESIKPDPTRMAVLAFQPRLLKALQRLELEYLAIAERKRDLVSRKKELTPGWFRSRMRRLAKRQEALRDAQVIGRTMGDSFAWLFYRDEQHLLDEHASQEFIVPIPTGVGGDGELAFISSLPEFAGLLVLHHGITTILRLGDVSLVDVSRSRVVAIGELKTNRPNDAELNIQVSLISPKGEAIDQSLLPSIENPRESASPQLSQTMASRLQRQLTRTAAAIRPAKEPPAARAIGVPGNDYAQELAVAIQGARRGRWTSHRAGPGLLFLAYRSLSRGLEGRLREMSTTAASRIAAGENPSIAVVPLILPHSAHNAIVTGSVLFAANGRPYLTRQAMPLVWLGVDRDLVFRMLTLDTQVIYVYNPAHLYAAFESKGWKVDKAGAPPEVVLRRQNGERVQSLHGMDWFIRDVTLGLRTEAQVAMAIELGMPEMNTSEALRHVRVQLDIRHAMPPVDMNALPD